VVAIKKKKKNKKKNKKKLKKAAARRGRPLGKNWKTHLEEKKTDCAVGNHPVLEMRGGSESLHHTKREKKTCYVVASRKGAVLPTTFWMNGVETGDSRKLFNIEKPPYHSPTKNLIYASKQPAGIPAREGGQKGRIASFEANASRQNICNAKEPRFERGEGKS